MRPLFLLVRHSTYLPQSQFCFELPIGTRKRGIQLSLNTIETDYDDATVFFFIFILFLLVCFGIADKMALAKSNSRQSVSMNRTQNMRIMYAFV